MKYNVGMTVKPKRATQSKNKSARKTKPKAEPKQKQIKITATMGALKMNSRGITVSLVIPISQMKQVNLLTESKMPDHYLDITASVKKKDKKVKNGKAGSKGYRGGRRRKRYPYKD